MIAELVNSDVVRAELWIAGLIGAAATIEDLIRRSISNWISLAALVGGFVCQCMQLGWRGLPAALAGTAAGFGIFLVFYLLGGMGGGDVKLMAGFGALLGAGRLLQAAFLTALIGGLVAAAVLAVDGIRRWKKADAAEGSTAGKRALFIPYAPAIASGVWLTLFAAVK